MNFTQLISTADIYNELNTCVTTFGAHPPQAAQMSQQWAAKYKEVTVKVEKALEIFCHEETAYLQWVKQEHAAIKNSMTKLDSQLKSSAPALLTLQNECQRLEQELQRLNAEVKLNRDGLKKHQGFRGDLFSPAIAGLPPQFVAWKNSTNFVPKRKAFIDGLSESLVTETKFATVYPQRLADIKKALKRIQSDKQAAVDKTVSPMLRKVHGDLEKIEKAIKEFANLDQHKEYVRQQASWARYAPDTLKITRKTDKRDKVLSAHKDLYGKTVGKMKLLKAEANTLQKKYEGLLAVLGTEAQYIDKKLVPGLAPQLELLKKNMLILEKKDEDTFKTWHTKLEKDYPNI